MARRRGLSLEDIGPVGPGTPAGEWLRRYWLAVSRSEDVKDIPVGLKIVGEELVLFRDGKGQIGLLGLHCPHRGTSLEYGDIEDRGIRCPYHGWLYDVSGQCLEQPAEPKGSAFRRKVRHLSYPARELGGLIFAYMGPDGEEPPPLPKYSALVREDGISGIFPPRFYEYNWFNFFENGPDIAHASTLHTAGSGHATRSWGDNFFNRADVPPFEPVETEYGMKIISHKPGPTPDTDYVHVMSVALPSIVQVTGRTEKESGDERVLFITPIDDGHFVVFSCDFHAGSDAQFLLERQRLRSSEAVERAKEYDRRKHAPFRGQVWKEDIVCQSTQGTIGRRKEQLGQSDRGVIMLRKMVLCAMEAVRRGKTPKGVLCGEDGQKVLRFDSFIGVLPKTELRDLMRLERREEQARL